MLVITSIQSKSKKKCGREDIKNLVKESLGYEMSLESLNETLNSFIESKSIFAIIMRNLGCLSLPK